MLVKYNKVRLLELLQTIRRKQGKPLTGKQGQRTSIRKTIMTYRQTKYMNKHCQELLNK